MEKKPSLKYLNVLDLSSKSMEKEGDLRIWDQQSLLATLIQQMRVINVAYLKDSVKQMVLSFGSLANQNCVLVLKMALMS